MFCCCCCFYNLKHFFFSQLFRRPAICTKSVVSALSLTWNQLLASVLHAACALSVLSNLPWKPHFSQASSSQHQSHCPQICVACDCKCDVFHWAALGCWCLWNCSNMQGSVCTPLLQIVLLTSNIIIVSQEQQVWTWERKQSSNMARFSASCGTFET